MSELRKGRRGPKKGTIHKKHKYLYKDEKGHRVYEEQLSRIGTKRGRKPPEAARKIGRTPKQIVDTDDLIKQHTDKSAEQWIHGNYGIALRLSSDLADRYNIAKLIDHVAVHRYEGSDGSTIVNVIPKGIYADMIQEATIGMWKGLRLWAERTSASKKIKISPVTAMYQGAENNLRTRIIPILKGQVASIPLNVVRQMNSLTDCETQLTMELGRMPTDKEILEHSSFTQERINKIREARKMAYQKALDETAGGESSDGRQTLQEHIKDPHGDVESQYIDKVTEREQSATIKRILNTLEPWQKEIIVRRFGLGIEKRMIPASYQQFIHEEPVKVMKIFKKKQAGDFEKQFAEIQGEEAKPKAQSFARVKNMKTGKVTDVPLATLKDIKSKKGERYGTHVIRVLKKTRDAKVKMMPRQAESWAEIAQKVKVPVFQKIGARDSKTTKILGEVSNVRLVDKEMLRGTIFPKIVEKLREEEKLKKVWEEMDIFAKSLTAELLKVRHNLA